MKLRLELSNPALFPDAQHARIVDGGLVIGRSAHADWVLPDAERVISKMHCRIERTGTGFVLIDTSANGVTINGAPVGHGASKPLSHGDVLTIGKAVVHVVFDAGDKSPTVIPMPADPAAQDLAFPAGPFGPAGMVAVGSATAFKESDPVDVGAVTPPTLQDWWIPDAVLATETPKSVDIPIVGAKADSFVGGDPDKPLSTTGSEIFGLRDAAVGIDSQTLVRAVEKAVLVLPGEERKRFVSRLCELLGGETAS